MATREQLIEALRRADAAGNYDDARAIAEAIKGMSGPTASTSQATESRGPDGVLRVQMGGTAPDRVTYGSGERPLPLGQTNVGVEEALSPVPMGGSNFLEGLTQGLGDTYAGIGQSDMHQGLRILRGVDDMLGTNLAEQGARNVAQRDAEVAKREADYQAATPDSFWAAGGGRLIGNIASTGPAAMKAFTTPVQTLGTLAARAPVASSVASLGGRMAGGGLVGAAQGAAAPVAEGDYDAGSSRNAFVGGALGMLPPALWAGVGGPIRQVSGVLAPILSPTRYVGQGLTNNMTQADAAQIAASIRNARQLVPGSLPTTAQLGATPYLVQTEKALANASPDFRTLLTQRGIDNNQARWNALNGVAQTPQALDAARGARDAAAGPLYAQARAGRYAADQALEDLMTRPAMQQALQRGMAIAGNQGNVGMVPATLNAAGQQTAPAQVSGDVLHYLKLGLDDLQASAKESTRLGPWEKSAIDQARRDFLGWLDNASPEYQQARVTYEAMSPPVNTMEAGQQIAERLAGAGRALDASGTPHMTAPGYAIALNQALKGAEFGIEPGAEQVLRNVGQDLQRSTISNSIRAGSGSDTAYNLSADGWLSRQLFGPTFDGASRTARGAGAIAATAAGYPMLGLGAMAAGSKLGTWAGGRLQARLGDLLLNPDAILPYLDARVTAPANAVPDSLMRRLLGNGSPAISQGLLSAFQ